MKFEIKHRNGATLYQDEAESFRALVMAAVKSGANLRGADLSGANLRGANLRGADLSGADLSGANLLDANLRGADLSGADLSGADLSGANLRGANLRGADLSGADLSGADLSGADLSGADLSGAKNLSELAVAEITILPEGPIIGWKKCRNDIIVKLLIPAKARKSNATGRKCRAEFVRVLQVFGAEVGISQHNAMIMYRKGETVSCNKWNEDRWVECGGGIHFFISRVEAENY